MRENYSGIVFADKTLACTGEDGHLKGLFWPYKDSRHSHLEFSYCGFSIDNHVVWLDPVRDGLRISFIPESRLILSSWFTKHPCFYGVRVTKTTSCDESAVTETWQLLIPNSYFNKKIKLWCLSSWKLNSQKRYQAVYSGTGSDTIYAYSGNTWLGIGACQGSFSNFEYVRALQCPAKEDLNGVLENFIKQPESFRCVEMGDVYAAASTHPLHLNCQKDLETYRSELSVVYALGRNQKDVDKKISRCFSSLAKENQFLTISSLPESHNQVGQIQHDYAWLKKTSEYVLKGLTDCTGALIAAPENDPEFKGCGGYGFVWPRDAAFCALSLMQSGLWEQSKSILLFLAKAQEDTGDFFQRYDAQGQKAPAWCELQADQLGLVLYAMFLFLSQEKNEFILACVKKGVKKLTSDFTNYGSLQTSFDLWEEYYGYNFYSHVCAYSALEKAHYFFTDEQAEIKKSMNICLNFCNSHFNFNKKNDFSRAIDKQGNYDHRADISLLACIFPFSNFPMEQKIKIQLFEYCKVKLSTDVGALRYENDHYRGGNSWILSGFWMAMAALRLSKTQPEYKKYAQYLFHKTAHLANSAGFYAEQVDSKTGQPVWVAPLAWSHAFYLWALAELGAGKDC